MWSKLAVAGVWKERLYVEQTLTVDVECRQAAGVVCLGCLFSKGL